MPDEGKTRLEILDQFVVGSHQFAAFALSQGGKVNTNRITATANGTLNLYLEAKAAKGFYYVSFRVPGANKGTP